MTDIAQTDGPRRGRKQSIWTSSLTNTEVNLATAELRAELGGIPLTQDGAIRACVRYARKHIAAAAAEVTDEL